MSRRFLTLAACVAACATLPAATAAAQSPVDQSAGDEHLTFAVGDDVAGGKTSIEFERVYADHTESGTPVYIYVPDGAIGDPAVKGMDPTDDPTPGDKFTPCADNRVEDFTITQDQIDTLGDELRDRIVAVDEAHYMPIEPADPDDPNSEALVAVAYNLVDEAYYDCEATQYTVGYFAPDFQRDYGMNVIALDTANWDELVGNPDTTDLTLEGVIAHELQHLLHNQSDAGELSWVDEGLADFAIFLNGYPTGGSHSTYHQVFHRETSLTRWGGGLENYGASFSFFAYVWEQAGGNGEGPGQYAPDLTYSGKAGDLLIKRIFENPGDGIKGIDAAIGQFNAETGSDLRSADELFRDWAVAVDLDREGSSRFDIRAFDFGNPATTTWTIALANETYWDGRDVYTGATPQGKVANRTKRGLTGAHVALPYSTSYQRYRNPGKSVTVSFDGDDQTQVAPHSTPKHWYAGYESQNQNILDVDAGSDLSGQTLDFWSWYFIEEGWDYGFVEALVNGQWQRLQVYDGTTEVTTSTNPQGNNEQFGLTGTSGGEYFVDEPRYLHLTATLPAGTTDVRFRYKTDAAYLDTGWFIDDVSVGGTPATLSSAAGNWFETDGIQDNDWTLQIYAPCDLTPGVESADESVDGATHLYRLTGDGPLKQTFDTQCLGQASLTTLISNLPTGDLTYLDAPYDYALTKNTGATKK